MGLTRTLTASDEASTDFTSVDAQYLMLAFDCARPLSAPVRLRLDVPQVTIGRGSQRAWARSKEGVLKIELADSWISSSHARLSRGEQETDWVIEDAGSKNGTSLNGVRVDRPTPLRDGDVIELGNTFAVFRALNHHGTPCDDVASPAALPALPCTLHAPWSSALSMALRAGRSATPILLLGETGTGKEVLARAIHMASGRNGPFVPVNCGAIVKTLVESELFGTRKGAFSGATEDRVGLVRSADGGTLFLDEIAELPESSQVALLRVLQERMVLPVGATRALPIDLRVVAATHEDLATRVAEGRFRADLYSRIVGHVTRMPRLRDRIEDVGLLIAELLPRLTGKRAASVVFTRSAGRALFMHGWPYNVRELEQALNAALAIASADHIDVTHLPEAVRALQACKGVPPSGLPDPEPVQQNSPDQRASGERERIVAALASCAGNQTRAAKALGISRATLVNKLSIHRVARPQSVGR